MLEGFKSQSVADQQTFKTMVKELLEVQPPVCGKYRFGLAITEDEMEVVCLNRKVMPGEHVTINLPTGCPTLDDAVDYLIDQYDRWYKAENYYNRIN